MGKMDTRPVTTSHSFQLMVNGQADNVRFPDNQLHGQPNRGDAPAGIAYALAGKALSALSENDAEQIVKGSGLSEVSEISDVPHVPNMAEASAASAMEKPVESQPASTSTTEAVAKAEGLCNTKTHSHSCAADSIFHDQRFFSLSGLIDRIAEQGYAMTQEGGADVTDKETIKEHLDILFHVYASPSGKGAIEISQQQFEKMTEDGFLIIDQKTKTISFPVKVEDFVESDDWWSNQHDAVRQNGITNFIEKVGDAATTNTP